MAKSPLPTIAEGSGVFVVCESSRGVRGDSRGVLSKFTPLPNAVSGVGVSNDFRRASFAIESVVDTNRSRRTFLILLTQPL